MSENTTMEHTEQTGAEDSDEATNNGCVGRVDGPQITEDIEIGPIEVDTDEYEPLGDEAVGNLTLERTEETDQITMTVTVDASGMSDKQTEALQQLARLYEDGFREVVAKNRDYGFSFLQTGAKLAQTEATPFETAVRSQAYGLLTRTGDKRERLMENLYGDGSAEVSDEPDVTAAECGNYWYFMALILSNPELAASFGEQ